MKYHAHIERKGFQWDISIVALSMHNDGHALPEIRIIGIKPDNSIEKETQMLNIMNSLVHILRGEPLPNTKEILNDVNKQIMTAAVDNAELSKDDVLFVDWEDLHYEAKITPGNVEDAWLSKY